MESVDGAICAQRQSPSPGLRESLLVMLVLYGLAPCDAFAGDQSQDAQAPRDAGARKFQARLPEHLFPAPFVPAPFAYEPVRPEQQAFSATEFRPRKHGLLDADPARSEVSVIDAPIRRDSSLAREIAEFKTQDRLRLLTLWQNRASSVSLQAGKHGAPSLQWSTPWMHRDVSSRGLFDRLLTVSPRSFGTSSARGSARQTAAIAPGKPLDLNLPGNSK
jgi:hypothetical protein